VSQTIGTLFKELDKQCIRPNEGGLLDLPKRMHWYPFDVTGGLVYGVQYDFMEGRSDVDGIIRSADHFLDCGQFVGQMPWLDKLLLNNPLLLWLNGRATSLADRIQLLPLRHKERRGNR